MRVVRETWCRGARARHSTFDSWSSAEIVCAPVLRRFHASRSWATEESRSAVASHASLICLCFARAYTGVRHRRRSDAMKVAGRQRLETEREVPERGEAW